MRRSDALLTPEQIREPEELAASERTTPSVTDVDIQGRVDVCSC
jgi:hypothetical protein